MANALWEIDELKISFSNVIFDDAKGSANWEAKYIVSKTGRIVHNKIRAEFEFKDSKIITHKDNFNLHRWAIHAFGLKGFLIGWAPVFKTKLNMRLITY